MKIFLINFGVLVAASLSTDDICTAENKCSESAGHTKNVYKEGLRTELLLESHQLEIDFQFYFRI